MAEASTGAKGKGNPLEALKRKVGPLPLGVWLALGLGIWWYMRKAQASSQTGPGGSAANGTTATGYGVDPAGNTGYIDPSTGYVYGSAEDVAALQNEGLIGAPATGSSFNTGGGGDTSGTGSTANNQPGATTGGTGTTTNPSGTATGTGTGGASVPPPTPTPNPPPASTSKSWKYPAPTGLHAQAVSDSGYQVAWSAVKGPSGQHPSSYTVATYQGNTKVDQFTSVATTTREYGGGGKGLKPGTTYRTNVWANGGPTAPSHASIVVTTKPKGVK